MRLRLRLLSTECPPGLGDDAERRARLVIGRLGDQIQRVEITLVRTTGQGGDGQWCCRAMIVRKTGPRIVVTIRDIDAAAAIKRSIDRSARRAREGATRPRTEHGADENRGIELTDRSPTNEKQR